MLFRVGVPAILAQVMLWTIYSTPSCLSCNPGYLFGVEKYHRRFNHHLNDLDSIDQIRSSENTKTLHNNIVNTMIPKSDISIKKTTLHRSTRKRRGGFGVESGLESATIIPEGLFEHNPRGPNSNRKYSPSGFHSSKKIADSVSNLGGKATSSASTVSGHASAKSRGSGVSQTSAHSSNGDKAIAKALENNSSATAPGDGRAHGFSTSESGGSKNGVAIGTHQVLPSDINNSNANHPTISVQDFSNMKTGFADPFFKRIEVSTTPIESGKTEVQSSTPKNAIKSMLFEMSQTIEDAQFSSYKFEFPQTETNMTDVTNSPTNVPEKPIAAMATGKSGINVLDESEAGDSQHAFITSISAANGSSRAEATVVEGHATTTENYEIEPSNTPNTKDHSTLNPIQARGITEINFDTTTLETITEHGIIEAETRVKDENTISVATSTVGGHVLAASESGGSGIGNSFSILISERNGSSRAKATVVEGLAVVPGIHHIIASDINITIENPPINNVAQFLEDSLSTTELNIPKTKGRLLDNETDSTFVETRIGGGQVLASAVSDGSLSAYSTAISLPNGSRAEAIVKKGNNENDKKSIMEINFDDDPFFGTGLDIDSTDNLSLARDTENNFDDPFFGPGYIDTFNKEEFFMVNLNSSNSTLNSTKFDQLPLSTEFNNLPFEYHLTDDDNPTEKTKTGEIPPSTTENEVKRMPFIMGRTLGDPQLESSDEQTTSDPNNYVIPSSTTGNEVKRMPFIMGRTLDGDFGISEEQTTPNPSKVVTLPNNSELSSDLEQAVPVICEQKENETSWDCYLSFDSS